MNGARGSRAGRGSIGAWVTGNLAFYVVTGTGILGGSAGLGTLLAIWV